MNDIPETLRRRFLALDGTTPHDRAAAERAIGDIVAVLDITPRPLRWAKDPAEFGGGLAAAAWKASGDHLQVLAMKRSADPLFEKTDWAAWAWAAQEPFERLVPDALEAIAKDARHNQRRNELPPLARLGGEARAAVQVPWLTRVLYSVNPFRVVAFERALDGVILDARRSADVVAAAGADQLAHSLGARLVSAFEAGVLAVAFTKREVVALPLPSISRDDKGRWHNLKGPAVTWPTGRYGQFWVEDHQVPGLGHFAR